MELRRVLSIFLMFGILVGATIASGCISGSDNNGSSSVTSTPQSTSKSVETSLSKIENPSVLLIVTSPYSGQRLCPKPYVKIRNNVEVLTVQYPSDIDVQGDKIILKGEKLLVFERNDNVIKVTMLKSEDGKFVFKPKKVYGDDQITTSWIDMKPIPRDEYSYFFDGSQFDFEGDVDAAMSILKARKVPLSVLEKGVKIDDIIKNYSPIEVSTTFTDKYAFFIGNWGQDTFYYTGEIIPVLETELWTRIVKDFSNTPFGTVNWDIAKEEYVAIAISSTAVEEGKTRVITKYNKNYDVNRDKLEVTDGTVKVQGLKTTDGYAIVVTVG